jgi:glycosyltransferase involved in cell wall biosynthesis
VRVLHVCPYMHPSAGGPPVAVERLCEFSGAEGFEASVITTSLYCADDGSELQRSLGKRIEITVLPIRGPRVLKGAEDASSRIDAAVRDADMVHLHTLWHPLNGIARRACRRHGRKYVMMPHGMLDPYSLAQKRWRKIMYLALAERRNLEGACRLVFTARQEEDAARKNLPWLPQGEVIPLAADEPPDRQAAARTFAALFPQVAGRRCLLFLGRIDPKKGLERLLAALPPLIDGWPDILAVVAGEGEPAYVRHIRNRVHELGLDGRVLLTGRIDGSVKWGALACAEIFVLPSKQENFAIAVAEAMHMAVPVVITDRVNSWPLVEEAGSGVVLNDATVESALGPRLNALLDAPDDLQGMGKRGQKFAGQHLTWPRVAGDMIAMYRRLLSE